jgi:Domain of unknown function (DUF1906)/D-alanyl-D-alanine carboxypeptidase/LGFP repeat
MTDPTCPFDGDRVIAHEQVPVHLRPLHRRAQHRLVALFRPSIVGPCVVPGVSLTDYSLTPQQKGWGAPCAAAHTTVTLSSGARVTVDSRVAELVQLVMEANIRQGYSYRAADTGAYNCRHIASNPALPWSNHAWALAIDCNWGTNPQHSPLITDRPAWERARWNRFGFAWGGDYHSPTVPDAMHVEFMGTPAQAAAATVLARAELAATTGSGVLPDKVASPVTGNMEIPGADFSYAKPTAAAIARSGLTFVLGYVSPTAAKNLTREQMESYRAQGLGVGLVWEATPGRAHDGATAGAIDGALADQQADALGYPVECVIFAAVDYDALGVDFPAIGAYLAAFNQATKRPVGVYGKADVIDAFVTPGVQPVQYGWQTAAWSAGRLSAKAHLYQRVGHPAWPSSEIPGGDFDEDVAIFPVPLHGWLTKPAPVVVPPPDVPPPTLHPGGGIEFVYNGLPQNMRDFMGALTVSEHATEDGMGAMAEWANACMWWSPATSARVVWGGICATYKGLGGEASPLGYPVSHELSFTTPDDDGVVRAKAANLFQHGSIVWDTASGSTTVFGA